MTAPDSFAAIAADLRALRTGVYAAKRTLTPHDLFWRAWAAASANAPKARAWKARSISLNPEPLHNAIALSGMAPIQVEDAWMLAVALPQPAVTGGFMEPVEDVVAIDPKSGRARLLGDYGATHVTPASHPAKLQVFTDARAWARDIALHRLEWYDLRRQRRQLLQAEPTWTGEPPSALLLAPPAKVRWSELRADVLDVPADLRRDVQRAIFAQANLPRIEGRA